MYAHDEEWKHGDRVTFTDKWRDKTIKIIGTITAFSQMGGIHYAFIWVAMKDFSGTFKRPLYMLKKENSHD